MGYWKAYGVGKGGWLASDQTLSVHIPKLKVLESPFQVNVMTPEQWHRLPNALMERMLKELRKKVMKEE